MLVTGESVVNELPLPTIRLAKIFWVFLYIGATSFGGGLLAYLREHLVERQPRDDLVVQFVNSISARKLTE